MSRRAAPPVPRFRCDSPNRLCRTDTPAGSEVVVWQCGIGRCGRIVCSTCEGVSSDDLCDMHTDPRTQRRHRRKEPKEIGAFIKLRNGHWRYKPGTGHPAEARP